MVGKLAVVAIVGALFGGFAIPAGLLLDLSPLATYLAALAGAVAITWIVLLSGGAVRDWLMQRFADRGEKAESRAQRLIDRYGVKGLGLIGPIFPGVAASSLAGLALGLDTRALARWMSVGSALLYAVYTLFWWAVAALF